MCVHTVNRISLVDRRLSDYHVKLSLKYKTGTLLVTMLIPEEWAVDR